MGHEKTFRVLLSQVEVAINLKDRDEYTQHTAHNTTSLVFQQKSICLIRWYQGDMGNRDGTRRRCWSLDETGRSVHGLEKLRRVDSTHARFG